MGHPSFRSRGRAGRLVGAAVLLAGAALAACVPDTAHSGEAHGVLVVAIDGLRADHVGCFGYDRPTTPALDALAAEGVFIRETFTTAPLARPAHIGLLSGCDPVIAQRFVPADPGHRSWRVPEGLPLVAVEFLASGYRTAAFIDDVALDAPIGLQRGFQEYVVAREGELEPDGHTAGQISRLLSWLRSLGRGSAWFAYLHLADLERSWTQPEPAREAYFQPRPELEFVPPVGNTDSVFFAIPYSRWRGSSRTLGEYEAAYDGHLRKVDEELTKLFAGLRRQGREHNTTVAVVGTHGVQFGEAGLFLRAGLYSMADLSVPWILRPREGVLGDTSRGGRVDALASLLDVAPTLLEIEGLPRPDGMRGYSLLPAIRGVSLEGGSRRFAFASCGLLEGGAVIGERYCLEFLQPARSVDEIVRRSWLGTIELATDADAVRFYDHVAEPYPPLIGGGISEGDESYGEFHRVADRWLRDTHLSRIDLQGELDRRVADQ